MKHWGKRLFSLILALAMVVSLLPPVEIRAEEFVTVTEIWTAEEFLAIMEEPDGSYRLMADIDLGNILPLSNSDGNQWFRGVLDGNGHTVRYNIHNTSGVTEYALFYGLSGAEITELRLEPKIDISISDAESYRVAALSVYCSISAISALKVDGSIRISGGISGTHVQVAGILASDSADNSLHSCTVDLDTEVQLSSDAYVNWFGITPGSYYSDDGYAYYCNLFGKTYLEAGEISAKMLTNAVDSNAVMDLEAHGRNASVVGDYKGKNNIQDYSIELYQDSDTGGYYDAMTVYGLQTCKESVLLGNIAVQGRANVIGAIDSEFVEIELDAEVDAGAGYSSVRGLSGCTDSVMTGDMRSAGEGTSDINGIDGERNLYYGDLNCNSNSGGAHVRGIYGDAQNCSFEGDIRATSNSGNASAWGISGKHCSFTGDLYANCQTGYVEVYGSYGGLDNVVIGDMTAYGPNGASATILDGSNSYYKGNVTAGKVYGIGDNCSAQANVVANDGYANLFSGSNSYFSGSVTVTGEDYVSLEVFGTAQNCVANVAARVNQTAGGAWNDYSQTVLFNTAGANCHYSGSASVSARYGHVAICSDFPTTVNHGYVGSWNTSGIPKEVCIHTYEGLCDQGCAYILAVGEDDEGKTNHHTSAIYVNRNTSNASSADASAGWDGSIDPDTGDYTPERDPANYTIQLIDTADVPVASAKLIIGGVSYITDGNGCVSIQNGPAIISNLEVQLKDGDGEYKTICTRDKFYPVPDKTNLLRLEYDFELELTFLGSENAENKTGEVSGGGVTVGNQTFSILKFPMNISLDKTLFKALPIQVKFDSKTQTVKSIIGWKDSTYSSTSTYGKNKYDELYTFLKDMMNDENEDPYYRMRAKDYLKNAEKIDKATVLTQGWNVQALGYAETDVKDILNPQLRGGGLMIKADYTWRTVYHPVVAIPPFYVTLAFNGGIESKLSFMAPEGYNIKNAECIVTGTVNPKISAEGAIGFGLRTARLYAEGGIRGTVDVKVNSPFEGIDESVNAKFTGDLFGEIRLLAFKSDIKKTLLEHQLWPWESSTAIARMMTRNSDSYTIAPRDYANSNVMLLSLETDSAAAQYMGTDSSAYPYAKVGLYPLDNGSYLLLYTDDALNRGDADRSALRACIGTEVNGQLVWGEAVTVEEDGTGDYGFQAAVHGNQVAVVWQDADQTFGNGEGLQPADLASHIVLSQTVLDCGGSQPVSGDIAAVAVQKGYPYNVAVYYDGNRFETVWTTTNNPDPSVYIDNEQETIWHSGEFGQEGNAVAEKQSAISGIALVSDNILWVNGEAGNVTLWNRSGDGNITAVDSGNILNLQSMNNRFCYTKDESLYMGSGNWDSVREASVGTGSSNLLRLSADGSVYAAQPGMETSRVCILEQGKALPIGEYEGYLSSWDAANGHIVTILRSGFESADTASFVSTVKEEIKSMEVGTIGVDNTVVSAGNWVEMVVNVSNDGYNPIENLPISIVAEDGTVLMEENVGCWVDTESNSDVSFGFTVPEGFTAQNVTVTVGGQAQTLALGGKNLSVEAQWKAYNAKGVSVTVNNTGLGQASGLVTLTDASGTVLGSRNVTVEESRSENIWFEFAQYYTEAADLTVTLTGVDGELTEADNRAAVAVRPVTASKIRVSESVRVNIGETDQIQIRAVPEGSMISALSFVSGDGNIATVDNEGNIFGISPGETTVTVTANNGNTYTVTVFVTNPTQTPPEDPEQPTEPTEPDVPTEPVNPEEPTQPSDPDVPTEPQEPNPPEESVKPAVRGVTRLAGNSRYETSFAIANKMKETLGIDKFDSIILANSDNFADALAGSYLAAVKKAPIIIGKQKYAGIVCDYVNKNLAEGGTVYVLGGEGAIPQQMLSGINAAGNIRRLAGEDRYGTNLAILNEIGIGNSDILIATGRDFADSLSASATGLPILLVNGKAGKNLSQEQKDFLKTVRGDIYVIGGKSAVPAKLRDEIEETSGKNTIRISGDSRYETSVKIAQQFLSGAESAVVAYASTFPDGLCGGPLAYAVGAPLILTKDGKSEAPDYTKTNAITSGYVLGGEGLISDGFAKTIFCVEQITR